MATATATPDLNPDEMIPIGDFTVDDLLMLHPNEIAALKADQAAAEQEAAAEATPPAPEAPPATEAAPPAQQGPDPYAQAATLSAAVEQHAKAIEDLSNRYDEGEITSAEFKAQLAELTDKRATDLAKLQNVQTQVADADQAWYSAVAQSMTGLGIKPGTAELSIFDSILKAVETNYPTLPDPEKIRAAEIQFKAAYGGTIPTTSTPTTGNKPPAPAPQKPTGPRTEPEDAEAFAARVPPVNSLPASAFDAGSSPFDSINQLIEAGDVYAAEQAIARLSPADQDRFLRNG